MKNREIADLFYQMAEMLEFAGVEWKPQAYEKAARNIESLSRDIGEAYKEKGKEGLKSIPGVGEGLAQKIMEYLETGRIREYEQLKKGIPPGLVMLMEIPGMGPKKAAVLYRKLKIDSIGKLEQAAQKGKIAELPGFGEKSQKDILKSIELYKRSHERMILMRALSMAQEIVDELRKGPAVEAIDIAGSLRRRKETIGDIDILVISSAPQKVMAAFTAMENVARVTAQGDTKSSVVLKEGLDADLRVLERKSYGTGLMYFTGSKEHNIALRQRAIRRGWKLSEYGLFDKKEVLVAGRTEEEVYKKLGLHYIEPEMRENAGEIEAAEKGTLPRLIGDGAVKGDLHTHTQWTDGQHSTEEMIQAAIKMGYEYIAITDHSKSTRIAKGMDEKRLRDHVKEIHALAKKYGNRIHILAGAEVDILADGRLDYDNKTLSELDVVVASVHSRFKSEKEDMTRRILAALENEHVTILGHPTGRIIGQRDPYEVDLEKVMAKAKENGIALEVNSSQRLDLRDTAIKTAVDMGVLLAINTDAHSTDQLRLMEFGIAQARRGWAEEKNVANAWPWKRFERWLRKRKEGH